MCDKKIEDLVNFAVEDYNLIDYSVSIEGKSNKGDGYAGDITFVSVTGTNKNGNKETLNLVIKSSKASKSSKEIEKSPMTEVFKKEIFIYDEVKAAFDKFQRDKGIENMIQFIPHCYATRIKENSEALILENLKSKGYGLWEKAIPMTFKHVQLVLKAYGQWHAFSMALKEQQPEVYGRLTKNSVNTFSNFLEKVKMTDYLANEFEKARNLVISQNEKEILEHLQFSKNDVIYSLTNMFFEESEHHVILHGDCWSSNFMFKFTDDVKNPSDVRILDWQCSGMASPVFDLSYFIYACSDTGEHKDVKELLKIYYESFSDSLKRLGCNPSDIFIFDKLVEHWKKFSRFGMFMGNFVVRICLCEADQIPDFGQPADATDQKKDMLEKFNFSVRNKKEHFRRIRNNLLHYVENVKQ